jgi:hypothetical protein
MDRTNNRFASLVDELNNIDWAEDSEEEERLWRGTEHHTFTLSTQSACPEYVIENFINHGDDTHSFTIVWEDNRIEIDRRVVKELSKLPHELVSWKLSGLPLFTTDVEVSEKFPEWILPGEPKEPANAWGNKTTPDYFKDGSFYEVKTRIADDKLWNFVDTADRKFLERRRLQGRIRLDFGYRIIAVSPNQVCVNNFPPEFRPTSDLCDELSSMVLMGNALISDLEQRNVLIRLRDKEFERKILSAMIKMNETVKRKPLDAGESSKYLINDDLIELYSKHPEMDIEEIYYLKKMAEMDFMEACKEKTTHEIDEKFNDMSKKFRKPYYDGEETIQKKNSCKVHIHLPMFIGRSKNSNKNDFDDMTVGVPMVDNVMTKIYKSGLDEIEGVEEVTKEELKEMDKTGKVGAIRDFESGKLVSEELMKVSKLLKRRKKLLKIQEDSDSSMEEEDIMIPSSGENQTKITRAATRKRGEQFKFEVDLTDDDRINLGLRGVEGKEIQDDQYLVEARKRSKVPFDFDLTDLSPIESAVNGQMAKECFANTKFDDGPRILSRRFKEILKDNKEKSRQMMGPIGRAKWDRNSKEKLNKREELSAEYFLSKYDKTQVSGMLQTFSLIIGEVAAAITHMCQPGEFMIKRMSQIGSYVLLKPNKINGHVSFSVLTQTSNLDFTSGFGNLFESWTKYNEEWSYSEFCSVNKHRISHYLDSNELMCLVAMHLSQIFKDRTMIDKILQSHFVGQMLIMLESKTPTVIVTLLSRYMYMESVKTGLTVRETWKILSKFPEFYRSTLSLWCCKGIINAAQKMAHKNPRIISENTDKDNVNEDALKSVGTKIKNLISWVTGEEIEDTEQMLYLSYMGVFRNKEEGDAKQGNFAIFGKIMTEELKLYDNTANWKNMGHKSSRKNSPHSYRVDSVISCGRAGRRSLIKKFGKNVNEMLKDRMLRTWKRSRWEDFSTFSASFVPPDEDEFDEHNYAEQKKKKTMNKRSKVMNTVLGLLTGNKPGEENCTFATMLEAARACDYVFEVSEEKLTQHTMNKLQIEDKLSGIGELDDMMKFRFCKGQPFEVISEIFSLVQERQCMLANVFKKAQHTGPREIFVLDILSRITINFMESASRSVCEIMPSEMLTKGTMKMKRIEDFFVSVNKEKKRHRMPLLVTESDSDDKATWCQQFMMKVFCCLKTALYGERDQFFDNLIRVESAILNLVTLKKLELPFDMLKDFREKCGREFDSFTESMVKLKEEFLNENGTHNLVDYGKIYLKNLSNMMQGILHYTSSLLHTCYSEYSLEVEKIIIEESLDGIEGNSKRQLIIHLGTLWMVSSDDSLTVRCLGVKKSSFNWNGKEKNLIHFAEVLSSILSFFNRRLARWCCMVHSNEKSTGPSFSGIMEFNSVWKVFSNTLVPTIKYIYSSIKLKICQEMDDRQRMMGEGRKQILENGGKMIECELAHILQMSIHYKMLGMTTNKWFDYYWPLCKQLVSPAFGYFLPDLPLTSGISSFAMNYCLLVENNENALRTLSYLFERGDYDFSDNGTPTIGVAMSIGSSHNYRNAVKMMSPPIEFEATVENDKRFLFREPENVLESVTMIFKKLQSAGAVNAFSFNSAYKMFIAGIYLLQSASVTIRMKSDEGWVKYWSSLMGICLYACNKIYGTTEGWEQKNGINGSLNHHRKETVKQLLDKIFPARHTFLRLQQVTAEMYDYDLVKTHHKLRQMKVQITVRSTIQQATATLTDCLKHKWFPGQFPRYKTNAEINCSMDMYTKLYKWVNIPLKSLEMNTDQTPFTGWMNMRDFLRSTEEKPNKIFALSAARSTDFEGTWFGVMRLTRSNSHIFVKPGESARVSDTRKRIDRRVALNEDIGIDLKSRLGVTVNLMERYCLSPESLGDFHDENLRELLQYPDLPRMTTVDEEAIKTLTNNEIVALLISNIVKVENSTQAGISSVINSFESNWKYGMQWRFVKEQTWDDVNKVWTGTAEVILLLDGRPVRIFIDGDMIMKIETNNYDVISGNGPLLSKSFETRLGVTRSRRAKADYYLDLSNGKVIFDYQSSEKCCPIYINNDLTSNSKVIGSFFKIRTNFSKSIDIVLAYGQRWIPIYSLKLKSRVEPVRADLTNSYLKTNPRTNIFKDYQFHPAVLRSNLESCFLFENRKLNARELNEKYKEILKSEKSNFRDRVSSEKEAIRRNVIDSLRASKRISKKLKKFSDEDKETISFELQRQWRYQRWEESDEFRTFCRSRIHKSYCFITWFKIISVIKAQSFDQKGLLHSNGVKIDESDLVEYFDSNDRLWALGNFIDFRTKHKKMIEKKTRKIQSDSGSESDSDEGFLEKVWKFYNSHRWAPQVWSVIKEEKIQSSFQTYWDLVHDEDRVEGVLEIMGVEEGSLEGMLSNMVSTIESTAKSTNTLSEFLQIMEVKDFGEVNDEFFLFFSIYFHSVIEVDMMRPKFVEDFDDEDMRFVEEEYGAASIVRLMEKSTMSIDDLSRAQDFDIDEWLFDKSTKLGYQIKNTITNVTCINDSCFKNISPLIFVRAIVGLDDNDSNLLKVVKIIFGDEEEI